jgi:hypothetical protein
MRQDREIVLLLHSVQTGSGAHQASYRMGTGGEGACEAFHSSYLMSRLIKRRPIASGGKARRKETTRKTKT